MSDLPSNVAPEPTEVKTEENPKKERKVVVTFVVTPEERAKIDDLAALSGATRSEVARSATLDKVTSIAESTAKARGVSDGSSHVSDEAKRAQELRRKESQELVLLLLNEGKMTPQEISEAMDNRVSSRTIYRWSKNESGPQQQSDYEALLDLVGKHCKSSSEPKE